MVASYETIQAVKRHCAKVCPQAFTESWALTLSHDRPVQELNVEVARRIAETKAALWYGDN